MSMIHTGGMSCKLDTSIVLGDDTKLTVIVHTRTMEEARGGQMEEGRWERWCCCCCKGGEDGGCWTGEG